MYVERAVRGLREKSGGCRTLGQLGFFEGERKVFDRGINRSHGVIFVTGPTGSGKSTTLYACLNQIDATVKNIMTVEDPIEYYLDGIGQTQVNTKVNMTFAKGLSAILRQDPDVVMIGEIRDLETAEIAVQATLTGHLVLSTLHTNTAVGAVTRLRDMGVEPFLLSSTLLGVLAQRLVRLLCVECKQPYTANAVDCERFGLDAAKPPTFHKAEGCKHCNYQGYRGRTGIYELVDVDDELRTMIHDGSGEHEIEHYVRQHSPGIRQDGLRRILAGDTSVEEVLRVTRED